ncbi:MAG TPA: hypothetical protein VFU23_07470, partial [Gemmatimonadales bacterium]|nr:hypothetical protein [Gemmatimonadales bacterium]
MLLGAGYDGQSPLADPCCGSGTIPIEAALLARRIAPGMHRHFAFERWPGFDQAEWAALRARAAERVLPAAPAAITGSDRDAGAVGSATENAARAGVAGDVVFRKESVSAAQPPGAGGWLVTNPPYGLRVGPGGDLRDLYARLGTLIRERWQGWTVAMLVAGPMPEREMGLQFAVRWESSNGGVPVRLLLRR